jgi:2-methylcitrate dehydratase PrpD
MSERLANTFARYFCALRFEDLPAEVREKAKLCVLDAIGCAFEAKDLHAVRLTRETIEATHDATSHVATVWGAARAAHFLDAAMLNCVAIGGLLHDDTLMNSSSHPAGPVIGAALAVAEYLDASGRDTLRAIVAGYELMGRLGARGEVSFAAQRRGFRANSIFGAFGAVAAAGCLLQLDAGQFEHAIAATASFACGVLEPLEAGSMEWRHETGVACRNGILAALFAQRGLSAAVNSIEGEFGFVRAFANLSADAIETATLGRQFEITQTFHKPFPTASDRSLNAALSVVATLVNRHAVPHQDVAAVRIQTFARKIDYPGLGYHGPYDTIDQAILSKPWAVAAIVKHGTLIGAHYEQMNDPELLRLVRAVTIEGVEGWNSFDCGVRITLRDGTVIEGGSELVDRDLFFPGHTALLSRIAKMTEGQIAPGRLAEIAETVTRLDDAERISTLTGLLRS